MMGVVVSIADAKLARTMKRAIAAALRTTSDAASEHAAGEPGLTIVRLAARRTLERLRGPDGPLRGALAIVKVSERNARHLGELVEGIRAAGARAVQLVWDRPAIGHERIERHVFAVLERARATPAGPPVILSKNEQVPFALRILLANRHRKDARS